MIIKIYFILINIVSFLAMGIDKLLAIFNKRRISEKFLITISIIGGCFGNFLGMLIFRHKIRKPKFYIIIPILLFIYLILFYTKKIPLF